MTALTRQFASLLLAGIYAFIALFGHGLHTHSSCESGACETTGASACLCGHDHGVPVDATPSSSHQTAAFTRADLSHNCAACQMLAQLSVGYSLATAPPVTELSANFTRLSISSAFCNPSVRLADARGPPAAQA